MGHFFASWTQLGVTVLVILAVVCAAFLFFPPVAAAPATPAASAARGWRPWALGLVAFICGSVFHLINYRVGSLPPAAVLGLQLVPIGIALAVIAMARRSPAWTTASADAVAVGALFVYCWWGFRLTYATHGSANLLGQCFPAGVILTLLALGYFRPLARRNAHRPAA